MTQGLVVERKFLDTMGRRLPCGHITIDDMSRKVLSASLFESNALLGSDLPQEDHIERIWNEVTSLAGVSRKSVFSPGRGKIIALARHLICWRMRRELNLRLSDVGEILGRHHTSIANSVSVVMDKMDEMGLNGGVYVSYER